MGKPGDLGWVVITRYVDEDGKIIAHAYGDFGSSALYPSRSRAAAGARRLIEGARTRYGEAVIDQAIKDDRLEVRAIRVLVAND